MQSSRILHGLMRSACRGLLSGRNPTSERPRCSLTSVASWPASDRSPAVASDLRLLRHFERIVYLDVEIPDGAFQLCMPEQQLNRSQVLRVPINQ